MTRSKNIPDDTISTFTDHILDIILLAHVEGNLAGPRSVRGVRSRHGRCGGCDEDEEKEERLSKKKRRACDRKVKTEGAKGLRSQSVGRPVEKLLE
jgi:hypothetical protein